MKRASPRLKHFAARLLSYEAARGTSAKSGTAAFRVGEKLRRLLSTLLGAGGFRALLVRAVTLAKAEAPELDAVQVNANGSLDGLGEIANADVILIAHLLALLVDFIGEALVLSLVLEAWPKATIDDSV